MTQVVTFLLQSKRESSTLFTSSMGGQGMEEGTNFLIQIKLLGLYSHQQDHSTPRRAAGLNEFGSPF